MGKVSKRVMKNNVEMGLVPRLEMEEDADGKAILKSFVPHTF